MLSSNSMFAQCEINLGTYKNGIFRSKFSAQILKQEIPLVGNEVTLTRVSSGFGFVQFILKYKGEDPLAPQSSKEIIIADFQNLEYLEVSDIECTLGGSLCAGPSVIISLSTTNIESDADLSDPDVSSTQDKLNNLSSFDKDNRKDYHLYEVENDICTFSENENCTIDNVFEFIKNNKEFQAPLVIDFPTTILDLAGLDPLLGIGRALNDYFSDPSNQELIDQEKLELDGNIFRLAAGVSINLSNLDVESCPINIEIAKDPIILVVDDNAKCITNYTLPGHILHPGKITRCVTSKDCGKTVSVVTTGEGLHFCGDTDLGLIFAVMNITVGSETFNNMDNRLISSFN